MIGDGASYLLVAPKALLIPPNHASLPSVFCRPVLDPEQHLVSSQGEAPLEGPSQYEEKPGADQSRRHTARQGPGLASRTVSAAARSPVPVTRS